MLALSRRSRKRGKGGLTRHSVSELSEPPIEKAVSKRQSLPLKEGDQTEVGKFHILLILSTDNWQILH